MLVKKRVIILFLISLCLISCQLIKRSVSPLVNITKIEVTTNHNELINTITNTQKINDITIFVNEHRSSWDYFIYDIPVGKIYLQFFDEEAFQGNFGIGDNFFTTHREGDFFAKSVSKSERSKIIDLISVQ